MKITLPLIGFCLLIILTGCQTTPMGTNQSLDNDTSLDNISSLDNNPSQPMGNNSPRLITPSTGGAPISGIPIGGNLYVPATGGPPVTGI